MVRLMLVLAPVMCILSGIGVSSMLSTYMKQYIECNGKVPEKKTKKNENPSSMKSQVILIRISLIQYELLNSHYICLDCFCICGNGDVYDDFICFSLHVGYF